jgi:Outer membrane protein beta-barrel domain
MKKYLMLLFVSLPILCHAQRFKGGLVLGLNASQIDGDKMAGYDKAGLEAGTYVYTELTKRWNIQMELHYDGKGSSSPKDADVFQRNRLNYIELPLLGQYALIKNVKLQFGVSGGYLFHATHNIGDGSGYSDFTSSFNKIELAGFGGVNLTYLDPINFNIRYSYSIFPIFTPPYTSSAILGNHPWYNNVITIGIYYRIGSKKDR